MVPYLKCNTIICKRTYSSFFCSTAHAPRNKLASTDEFSWNFINCALSAPDRVPSSPDHVRFILAFGLFFFFVLPPSNFFFITGLFAAFHVMIPLNVYGH